MSYVKQLDSIRGIAALFVIVFHWLPKTGINALPNGAIGVNMFFVLSGFLITRILFEMRNQAELHGDNKLSQYKKFFFRRVLRIFPIYYLYVFSILVFFYLRGYGFDKSEFIYGFTYTLNFYIYQIKYWPEWTVHLWSLAVEEQFYLFWPLIILFINKRLLLPVIILFILTGIISQALMTDFEFGYTPTYTCFDALGFGALLSWIVVYKTDLLERAFRWILAFVIVCLLFLFIQLYFGVYYFERTIISAISLLIISYVIIKNKKNEAAFPLILNNKILMFLGKISYGLYLYHVPFNLLKHSLTSFINKYLPSGVTTYVVFFIDLTLLVILASLSWRFIEKPVLSLKKYFEYGDEKKYVARQANAA